MTPTDANPELDAIFERQKNWKAEMLILRGILLSCGLNEVKKWWQPCYAYKGSNLFIIGSFKEFCTLSFFKGVLLKDSENILQFAGPNTRSAKIIKFTSAENIKKLEPTLRAYILESIEHEKLGKKVELKAEETIPDELTEYFAKDEAFQIAFQALTPGRRRSWLLHYSSAKQAKTRHSRIEKSREKVMAGKGLNE